MDTYQCAKVINKNSPKSSIKTCFVRYKEGAALYSMYQTKFERLAKDANAIYKVDKLVLVNTDILDDYLETFHIIINYS